MKGYFEHAYGAVSGMKAWRLENGIDDEEQRQAQSLTHGERISRLEAIIETVLPHLATKEDLARSETRIILWVVGTVVGTGISIALGLGGLLVLLLD